MKREPTQIHALEILPKHCYYGSNNSGALEIMQLDVSHELFRDDVLRLLQGLGRNDLASLLEIPSGELPARLEHPGNWLVCEDFRVLAMAKVLGKFRMAIDWEEVVRLYRAILRESGGEFGFVSEGTMRYIVDALEHMKGDAFAKAAYAMHEIATKHPLANGNKRLALALGDVLLRSEGYRVGWQLDETVKFMLRVARGEVSQKEIEGWLRTRSKKTL